MNLGSRHIESYSDVDRLDLSDFKSSPSGTKGMVVKLRSETSQIVPPYRKDVDIDLNRMMTHITLPVSYTIALGQGQRLRFTTRSHVLSNVFVYNEWMRELINES